MNDEAFKQLTLSEKLEAARSKMTEARSMLFNARHQHGWADRIDHVEGLLTCGISALYHSKQEITKFEIQREDEKRGPHINFRTRGIGLDICPGCFVCGIMTPEEGTNPYLHNIAAIIDSTEDGEKLVEWFGGRARFAQRGESRFQFKVGTCISHLPNLQHLDKQTARYGVIRQIDIDEAMNLQTENP